MDFMLAICQFNKLKTLLLFITLIVISSCAKEVIVRPVSPIEKKNWFNTSSQYSMKEQDSSITQHLFFDPKPYLNLKTNIVDVIVTTPRDSSHHFNLDLLSGRRYYSHSYCAENDVWDKYKASINGPPYTIAFIPKVLDLFKKPQRVIVLGEKKYISANNSINDELLRVRIIGGVVEQYCDKFPCKGMSKWKSRVTLVAVSTIDPELKDVKSIGQVKKFVDWKHVKAFIENGRGRIISDKDFHPSYRVINTMAADKALKYAIDSGHVFSRKEMRTLRRSCEAVYGKLWKVRNDVLEDKQSFSKGFSDFYKKYWKSYNTCSQFVRYSNILKDMDQHWFYEYIRAFSLAEKLDYVYFCSSKTWIRNVYNFAGNKVYNQSDNLQKCTSHDLNLAFEKAINLLTGLSNSGGTYYKYTSYDHKVYEVKNKLYSWLEFNGKRQLCSKPSRIKGIFPDDISWVPLLTKEEKSSHGVYINKP